MTHMPDSADSAHTVYELLSDFCGLNSTSTPKEALEHLEFLEFGFASHRLNDVLLVALELQSVVFRMQKREFLPGTARAIRGYISDKMSADAWEIFTDTLLRYNLNDKNRSIDDILVWGELANIRQLGPKKDDVLAKLLKIEVRAADDGQRYAARDILARISGDKCTSFGGKVPMNWVFKSKTEVVRLKIDSQAPIRRVV